MTPALLAVALTATAAPAGPPPAWGVNQAASELGFRASMGGQGFAGRFRRWTARIRFDPAALDRSSVTATIDTGSAVTGDATRDESLPQADWFAATRFPRATFTATRFRSLGGNRYRADGMLSIKGVSRPAALPFQLMIKGDQARMQAALTINRATFGIGQGQFAGPESIPHAVTVTVRIAATRQR